MGIMDTITAGIDKMQAKAEQKATDVANAAKEKIAEKYRSAKAALPPPFGGSLYNARDKAKTNNPNNYDLKTHSFPDNITTSSVYGGNYVVFYINVNIESKFLKDAAGKDVATIPDNMVQRDRGPLLALGENMSKNMSDTQRNLTLVGVGAAADVAAGAFGGGLVGGGPGALIGATANALPAAIGVGAAASQSKTISRAQKRLKTAIALYIPNQLSARYGMQWNEEDTFAFQATASAGNAILKALETGGTTGTQDQGITDGASVIGAMGLRSKQGAAASAMLGLAANPKKEQLFKGVDYRTFAFDYQFFPRDGTEAANVMAIIKEFKLNMHPEFKDATQFLYIYPSEFDIEYYVNSNPNEYLHRHTSCVLTELNINYTPNGQFNTFANGMPTQINISMQFKEISLLSKEKIQDGL